MNKIKTYERLATQRKRAEEQNSQQKKYEPRKAPPPREISLLEKTANELGLLSAIKKNMEDYFNGFPKEVSHLLKF